MVVIPWLDKCEILSISDKQIFGVITDKGMCFKILPPRPCGGRPSTLEHSKTLEIRVKHLGSHVSKAAELSMPLADPRVFDLIIKLIERIENE